MFKVAILISGNGSNLQAIIDKVKSGALEIKIDLVLSDKVDAYGLKRAKAAGIQTCLLVKEQTWSRQDYDVKLKEALIPKALDLIVLSGFMRILGDEFVGAFRQKIINIHPSLLPKYPGLDTYRKALANKDKEHGCSVHFVTEELDLGPIIGQKCIPVYKDDDENSLRQRTQEAEHGFYWQIIKQLADKKQRA
jgi:phosphoribosylglycinamide formyltransferase 1